MRRVISIFGAAVAGLWAVDVLVNLGTVEGFLVGRPLSGDLLSYAGLALAELQVAVGVVAASFPAAALAAAVARTDRRLELGPALAAAMSGVTLLAGFRAAWRWGADDALAAFLWTGGLALALWLLYRRLPGLLIREPTRIGKTLDVALAPALVVGWAGRALALGSRGEAPASAASAGLAAAVLAVALFGRTGHGLRARVRPGSLALVAAVLLASITTLPPRPATRAERAAPANSRTGDSASPPDIVLIVLDTLRADRLLRYGYERDTMPALERWAETAVVFERAISAAGWTAPAHASMFSGRLVSEHGIHYSLLGFSTSPYPGIDWLPQRLSRRGYYCLAVVSNRASVHKEIAPGFDRLISPDRAAWIESTIGALADDRSPLLRPLSERLRWRMPYADAAHIVNTVQRAAPDSEQPLFLFVNLMDAHSPYNPPAWTRATDPSAGPSSVPRYRTHRQLSREWHGLPAQKHKDLGELYDRELSGLDRELARLLAWVERREGPQPVVIVTSDHGEELGEDGRVGHEYGLSQALLHVPLMIGGGDLAPAAFTQIVSTRKLYDFIDSIAAGNPPDPSLLIDDSPTALLSERYVSGRNADYFGTEYARPWVSLFSDELKAVGPRAARSEVFGLATDFDRLSTAGAVHGDAATSLLSTIDEYWAAHRDGREESDPSSSEQEKRLRALGYLQ